MLIGSPDLYLLVKSSLSSILATVYFEDNLITSSKVILPNHSELYTIFVFSLIKILEACSKYDCPLLRASSKDRDGRVIFLPEGSPIIPVKSPIIRIA